MERLTLDFSAELKILGEDTGMFEGYGSVFGNVDQGQDIVQSGAFTASLQKRMPALLWQHDPSMPIGKYTEAKEDAHGLYVKGELNLGTQAGKEAYALLKQGALKGLSIGFKCLQDAYDSQSGIRNIIMADLFEVSMVTFPMNEMAQVTRIKSLPKTERELEKLLRQAGFGRTQAKAIVAGGFKSFHDMQRDADVETNLDLVQREADAVLVDVSATLQTLLQQIKGTQQ